MSGLVRAIAIVAVVVVVLYAALLTAIYFGRNKLLFPGAGIAAHSVDPAATFPGAEDLKIPVDGGTYAHAWWIPSQSGTVQTLLYFHGNGYALEDELREEAPTLYQNRANLLLVDYRGYGASSPLTTTAESTAADARAAFRYLTEDKHVAPSDIWIAGRSIGAAVAVRLAAETPTAAGLILITPTSNTADVEPYRRLIRPLVWLGLTREFDSRARMPQIHMPVTIVAGSLDTIAPPWMAQALFDAANFPKSIKVINGAGHNDIFALATPAINLEIEHAMLPPATAASDTNSVAPTQEVLRKYFSLVAAGELLTPDGWNKASALFTSAKPYSERSAIFLTTTDPTIGRFLGNGTAASVVLLGNDTFGQLDEQLTLLPPDKNQDAMRTGIRYQLEFTGEHLMLDENGRVTSKTSSPAEWKIVGPLESREAMPAQASAYLTRIRDTTKDAQKRKAAQTAIDRLKSVHASCSC